MRVLGVDPGEVRIGVAISDPHGVVAVPVGVYLRADNGSPDAVAKMAQAESAELIVIGLPLSLDGSIGPQARRARRFAHAVQAVSGVPVVLWDERFTTQQAGRAMIEAGTSRKRRRSAVDAAAATILLQEYLDCHPQPPRSNASI